MTQLTRSRQGSSNNNIKLFPSKTPELKTLQEDQQGWIVKFMPSMWHQIISNRTKTCVRLFHINLHTRRLIYLYHLKPFT